MSWDALLFHRRTLQQAQITRDSLVGRALTSLLCFPFTVGHMLRQPKVWASIAEADRLGAETLSGPGSPHLVIHVVGASSSAECTSKLMWRELVTALRTRASAHPSAPSKRTSNPSASLAVMPAGRSWWLLGCFWSSPRC